MLRHAPVQQHARPSARKLTTTPAATNHRHPRCQAAYPHLSSVYSSASGAIVAAMLMLVASSWLLLHAAAQWARTRSEAKLLRRLPTAADLAAAAAGSADVPVVTAASV